MKSVLLYCLSPSRRQLPICTSERSASAVAEEMFTWVSSAYKWWSNFWLWIRQHRVNSSCPRTEPWGTPENKGTAFEKQFLILLIETFLSRMSCDLEQNNQWCKKLQINLIVLVLWPFLCSCLKSFFFLWFPLGTFKEMLKYSLYCQLFQKCVSLYSNYRIIHIWKDMFTW